MQRLESVLARSATQARIGPAMPLRSNDDGRPRFDTRREK
jgi:hypothetical protein